MTEKETTILKKLMEKIPVMTEMEREKFVSFGEGMCMMLERREKDSVVEKKESA